jgi:hypothetical protein
MGLAENQVELVGITLPYRLATLLYSGLFQALAILIKAVTVFQFRVVADTDNFFSK